MLLDEHIKGLIEKIEKTDIPESHFNVLIKELINSLNVNLKKPELVERYNSYKRNIVGIEKYPIGSDGYAISYDPFENEEVFWNIWSKYGIVVGRSVVPREVCNYAIERMHKIITDISGGSCDLDNQDSWINTPVDGNGVSFLSRGFFEIYHDRTLSSIRQSLRLYIHHVLIWGRTDLWTSFDRLGVKLPGHEESYGLPLHVDQNPRVHPDFKTIQGVLALSDCPIERGTFVGVPGSKSLFQEYKHFSPETGEFVQLDDSAPIAEILKSNAEPIPLRTGDIVTWDSRTTHANTENKSDKTRFVAYVAAGPAREDNPELVEARSHAFISGVGSNVREALMHASKKSRYSNYDVLNKVRKAEELNLLGRLLYGQEKYGKN